MQQSQHLAQDRALQRPVVRTAKRVPQRVGYGEGPRRADASGDVREHGDGDGCDSPPFDLRLGQTDRLVTHGSHGDHERDVHLIPCEHLRHLG